MANCRKCYNYESGDESVGLGWGCISPHLYDENDELKPEMEAEILDYLLTDKECPYMDPVKIIYGETRWQMDF